jgi:hypothetical protein
MTRPPMFFAGDYEKTLVRWRRSAFCLFISTTLAIGCRDSMAQTNSPSPTRNINSVLAAHDKELMKIPNVVGVYVGLLEDGKTPCLKVMLVRKSPETERAIPRSLEGYPVVTEVTGEIRPRQDR